MQANQSKAEQYLDAINHERRGKLRIYFGAVAGVGKTYRMLKEAAQLQEAGRSVLIGWVETHQREDTAAQLSNLPLLPAKTMYFQNKSFSEFDLDAAIAAAPEVLLLDELAHSNVVGSRHPKRWQDIEELLQHGIDVWTTLNVQHLDSLNDVIGTITHVKVTETVPDVFFNRADELILVDVTANELLHRLQTGKIYANHKIQHAQQHFFRKGNLISLREIALRKLAEALETDVKSYRQQQDIETVWATDAGLLACVTGKDGDDDVVRGAARMAAQWHCDWHVVFVPTLTLHSNTQPEHQRRVTSVLKFAESLGANSAMLHGDVPAKLLVAYARRHNLSRIVTGRQSWLGLFLHWRIQRLAPELDVIQLSLARVQRPVSQVKHSIQGNWWSEWMTGRNFKAMALMLVLSVVLTVVLAPLAHKIDNSNMVMLYLLLVLVASLVFGRSVAVLTSVVTVGLFDYAFVEPRYSFSVRDVQYLMTLMVMLVVSMVISQLTAHLKKRAALANRRERQAVALFDFAKVLSGLLETDEILHQSQKMMAAEFNAQIGFVLPDANEHLHTTKQDFIQISVAEWAYKQRQEAGFSTHTLPEHPVLYVPLMAPIRIRGILAVAAADMGQLERPEIKRQLQIYASLIALSLERVHFAEVAQEVLTEVETEKMRNNLLSTISHDLRTPLTTMMGEAEFLNHYHQQMAAGDIDESLSSINQSAQQIWRFVSNLLEMARLESGQLKLQLQPLDVDELITETVAQLKRNHPNVDIQLVLAENLPILKTDALLLTHALNNLLENSIKYSQSPSIQIHTWSDTDDVCIRIIDNGKGLPAVPESELFKKFYRGEHETAIVGSGLGLSIAKWVVEAHHGNIRLSNRQDGQSGCVASITLPISEA